MCGVARTSLGAVRGSERLPAPPTPLSRRPAPFPSSALPPRPQCPNGRAGAATPALRPSSRRGGASPGTAPPAPPPRPERDAPSPHSPPRAPLAACGRTDGAGRDALRLPGGDRGAPSPRLVPAAAERGGGRASNGGIRCSRGRRAGQARPPAAACALSGSAGPAPRLCEEEPGEQRASPGISSLSGRERKCGAGGDGAERQGLSVGLAVAFAGLQLPPAAPLPSHPRR